MKHERSVSNQSEEKQCVVKPRRVKGVKPRESKNQRQKFMAEGNFVQPAIPRFDGHYDHWAMLMENLLRSKDYWSLIESGIPASTPGAELMEVQQKHMEEMRLKDLKVKNYLFQSID